VRARGVAATSRALPLIRACCIRTLWAYKAHFGREVAKDNEAWFFYGPDLVRCYFPDGTGKLTSKVVRVSTDTFVGNLLESLDLPDSDRKMLQPLNAPRFNRIRALPHYAYTRVIFVGPGDVSRRDWPAEDRRYTDVKIMAPGGKAFMVRVDIAYQHGDFVVELKKILHKREGIKPCQQRLVFNGKKLQDFWRLRDAGITSRSVIHLLRVPCGC
jgi:hypothetical protein